MVWIKFLTAFCWLLLFGITDSYSQILKVDKGNIDSDSSRYFLGNLGFSFNLNNKSGTADKNVTFLGLDGNTDMVYVADRHAYILINELHYFKSTGGPLISNGFAHFRINWMRKKILSYETFAQIQQDNGRNLSSRYLIGAGLRWKLPSSEKSKLHMGIGVMHESEEWKPFDGEDLIQKRIIKSTSYIGGSIKLKENINFRLIVYYQSGYDTQNDLWRHRISGDTRLSFNVTDRLDFVVSFSAQYEQKPIIPINSFVYTLSNGLKWSF